MVACAQQTTKNNPPGPTPTLSNVLSHVTPPSTPLVCPGQQNSGSNKFVSEEGSTFLYQGRSIQFYGYTSYPEVNGRASAWHKANFTQYIDHTMEMGSHLGQNLFRPTDYWDQNDSHPEQGSNYVWQNMDYLVCSAQSHGLFIEMDLSAFQKVLISQHLDDFAPNNWIAFLTAVGKHYGNQSSIAFYSIVGEPKAPTTIDAMNKLVAFYRKTTDTLHQADPNHLIMAGGFNHMEEERTDLPWWHRIYALPNNNIAAFKTYSLDDLHLIPTIATFAKEIGKPAFDEEFGMPQSLGDATFAGGNGIFGIRTGRAQFYQDVYYAGQRVGVQGFVFWNLGCNLHSDSYQVNPNTSATWSVVKQYGPASSKTESSSDDQSLCP
jgi:hypothetical protein